MVILLKVERLEHDDNESTFDGYFEKFNSKHYQGTTLPKL